MFLEDHVAHGALAISGALLVLITYLWPGFIGPWFWILAVASNAHAALGIGWGEEDDIVYRIASTNSMLLLPLFFPIAGVLGYLLDPKMEDEDGND